MEIGNIVEYIDNQRIICAVVMDVKSQRLRLITELNREVNLSLNRLSHKSKVRLDISIGRTKIIELLNEVVSKRKILINSINIKELWEILNTEQEWIDIHTMTGFCFSNNITSDHESAVIRAFFNNKIYFKFNVDQFFPNSEEHVNKILAQEKENEQKIRIVEQGGDWIKRALKENLTSIPEDKLEIIEIIKSYYLFEKESPSYDIGKALISRAGIKEDEIFQVLLKLKIWDENVNINLYRYKIPFEFPKDIETFEKINSSRSFFLDVQRKDFTRLPSLTIDGQATLDFDDSLSIEDRGEYFMLGIHIADVCQLVQKDSPIDKEASVRGSTIYMPDQKIPMLPPFISEDFCSLKEGKIRPAISVMIKLNKLFEIIDYEIVPSIIQVKRQLTYFDVSNIADLDKELILLQNIAKKFRYKRLDSGAVHISLPEINIWINENKEIILNRINRESPGRMLVSELMIMANWLMAKFLSENNLPTIYRTQIEPKERLYKGIEPSIFQNWMQRKYLHRFILNHKPNYHSGLGLDVYVTSTSPIRKYFDLVTQRQIRSVLGYEKPYTKEEIDRILHLLEEPMRLVSKIQQERHHYWILKYLESNIDKKEEAIIISKKRNYYFVLLTEYMIECVMPAQNIKELHPEETINITIQKVNARKDILSVSYE